MKKIILYIILALFANSVHAQVMITGRVQAATDKAPVAGALVRIIGSSQRIQTDSLGNFRLAVSSPNLTIEISHVSYDTQQVRLNGRRQQSLNIEMIEKLNKLQDVTVSTGYQTLSKERATGSFDHIGNKVLSEQVSTNILSRLEAVANGLIADRTTSGGNGRLMIRGLSTIQGPKDPLIIVDNFPYEGDINNINPNDVESINILKDAAAASIWGTRAGNGVIVITTKKGRMNQPLSVDFNANITVGNKPDLFYIPQISSADYIDVETMLYNNNYYNSQISSSSRPALSPVVELLIKKKTANTADAAQIDQQLGMLRNTDVRNDFAKYIYQRSANQQYAIGLRGGSQNMAWNVSSGYDRNQGNLDERYERYNLRFQTTVKLVKSLELAVGTAYSQTINKSGRPGYGNVTSRNNALFPYAQFADDRGRPLSLIKDIRQSYAQTAGNGKLLNWEYYPLTDAQHLNNTARTNDIVVNSGLNYRLIPGLSVDLKYQFEQQQIDGRDFKDENSYFTRNLINTYTQISPAGEITYKVPVGGILDLSENLLRSNSLRGQMNYNKSWLKHEIAILTGAELRDLRKTRNSNRIYGYNDENLTLGNVDLTTQYPNFITGSRSFIPGGAGLSDETTRFVSTFANGAYTYLGRYTVSLSARRDASNLFGVNTNDKWNPLWSTGLSWNIAKEEFFKIGWLPVLRLRATYGKSGNVDPTKSAVTTIQYVTISPYTLTPYSRFSRYANPELKWENIAIFNLAVDFATAGNRLNGSIEFYRKKGTDLFGTSPVDYTTGIGTSIIKNVASIRGTGVDIDLNSLNVNGQFKWQSFLNLSLNHDKVSEYYLVNRQGSFFVNGSNNISGLTDKPVYSVFAYRWAGLDPLNGAPRGYLNGQVSKDYALITTTGTQIEDLQYFGSAIPTIFGSLGNTFTYRQFSLNVRFQYKFGYYFRRTSIDYPNLYANWAGHADISKRWIAPGDEARTDVPAMSYPYATNMQSLYTFSAPLVERGDHIRLQYVNLSYELTKIQWRSLPFRSLQCFMNLNNLGLVWRANSKGIDPDYNGASITPPPLTGTIGLRGSF